MKTNQKKCPECGLQNVYAKAITSPTSSHLLSLGSFMRFAEMEVVVCADCGLTRLYAGEKERTKLPKAKGWKRL